MLVIRGLREGKIVYVFSTDQTRDGFEARAVMLSRQPRGPP